MKTTKSMERRKLVPTCALIALAILPLAALSCRSGPPRDGAPEQAREMLPPLTGKARFAEDALEVEATLSLGGMARISGAGGPHGGSGRPAGSMGGMGGPPGGMGMGGGGGGMMGGPRAGGPSHTLVVSFANTGVSTVEFTIVDVKSRLGNFAPQPDTLALASGQSGTLYPMRGSLPDDIAELELTIAIRRHDGTTETRVLLLKPDPAAAGAAGP